MEGRMKHYGSWQLKIRKEKTMKKKIKKRKILEELTSGINS